MCAGSGLLSYLLHEEVVHAAVVVGRGEDVQCVVLPLGGFQSDAADLHTATPRRLLVLLTVPGPPRRSCLQIWTVRRRRAFWEDGHKDSEAGGEKVDYCYFVLVAVEQCFCLCIHVYYVCVCVCVCV